MTAADILADPALEEVLGELDLQSPEVSGAFLACIDLLPLDQLARANRSTRGERRRSARQGSR